MTVFRPRFIAPPARRLVPTDYFTWTEVGRPFLFTADRWHSEAFYLEVYWKSTSGIMSASLRNVTDDETLDDSRVDTASTDYVRTRSEPVELVDGKEYQVQFGRYNTGSGTWKYATLINQ